MAYLQLKGSNGDNQALFQYDEDKVSLQQAETAIQSALEEFQESDYPLDDAADKVKEELGMERIFVDDVFTNIL